MKQNLTLLITVLIICAMALPSKAQRVDLVEISVNDSLRQKVMDFGQLADLCFDHRRKQIREQSPNEQGELKFRRLFGYNNDSLEAECTIFNFIDPLLDMASCYSSKQSNNSNEEVWECLKPKFEDGEYPIRLSVEEFIYCVNKTYTKSFSYIGVPLTVEEMGMNKVNPMAIIDVVEESKVKLTKTRYQKVAAAPIAFSGDWVDLDQPNGRNASYLLREDYNCKLIFYISYDIYKQNGKRHPSNFKIDSVSYLPPIIDIREYVASSEK